MILISFLFAGQVFSQASLLNPVPHPKFVNPLPFPAVMEPSQGGDYYDVYIQETSQDLGIVNSQGQPFSTTVWGYGPEGNVSYPGPTIEARTNIPITVKWNNYLPKNHLFPIDRSIHWAGTDLGGELPEPGTEFNGIPTVTHLHGGHTDADSDGHPEAWYTPGFTYTGSSFYPNNGEYYYDNSQEAATLWYHDHVIGITRLNVYAGLAGFYLLRDNHEDGLNLPKDESLDPGDENSPIEHFEIPLVIQDRSFSMDGQLYYPSETFEIENDDDYSHMEEGNEDDEEVIYNSILPEMFGDFILVNGKAWPYLNVQPRKYRLRLLNGSDSRFYDLRLPGVQFYQIGSDGGLLEAPVKRNNIVIGPGERIDVVVDFSAPELWGQSLIMKNTARSPYPFGDTPNPQTSGKIMAFNVVSPLNNPDTSEVPSTLRNTPPVVAEGPSKVRELVLFEETDEFGRLLPSLGTAEKGALTFMDELTENPELGATEVWEIYNTTPDAHPIHLHLVHFQVLNTQKFNVKKSYFGVNGESSVQLLGKASPPAPENAGRKDTFIVFPGEVARVKALFDKEGEYVWHCHILSHEDHDMMRPFFVGDYTAPLMAAVEPSNISPEILESLQVAPNPVQEQAKIYFRMKTNAQVLLEMYNFKGQAVSVLYNGLATGNRNYEVTFDRSGLPPGIYVCKLFTADGRSFERIVMAK